MQPPNAAPADTAALAAISRFVAELAHAPECDPGLAHGGEPGAGDVLDRYELLREIGRGGFGVVFEARDRALGRRVAVKTVRRGAPVAPACESLRRERDAARLRHPNIVRVLEGGRCERGPFVVLEYLAGETLARRLARGSLPFARSIRIAVAVARALAYAHARGVLHRDLKPANVFLPSAGEPKVIDFGLARMAGRGGPSGSGTSGYMAPEQRRGGPEDARTDLFALGLLIREMATGTKVLPAGEPGGPAASSRSLAGAPSDLERIAAALVEPDPARRPGSADEVLESLLGIQRRLGMRARRGHRSPAAAHRDVRRLVRKGREKWNPEERFARARGQA